jgi:hypothetical protein
MKICRLSEEQQTSVIRHTCKHLLISDLTFAIRRRDSTRLLLLRILTVGIMVRTKLGLALNGEKAEADMSSVRRRATRNIILPNVVQLSSDRLEDIRI